MPGFGLIEFEDPWEAHAAGEDLAREHGWSFGIHSEARERLPESAQRQAQRARQNRQKVLGDVSFPGTVEEDDSE